MAFERNPRASATIGGDQLPVSDGEAELNINAAPYGLARVSVPLTDVELVEGIDPYEGQRLQISASSQGTWSMQPGGYTPWVTQRTNLFRTPRGTTNSSVHWGTANGTLSTRTDMTGAPHNTALRWTRSATGAARLSFRVGTIMPSAGEQIRVQMVLRASVALTGLTLFARATDNLSTGQTTLGTFDVAAGVNTIDISGTTFTAATTSSSGVSITLPSGQGAVGATMDVTAIIIELAPGGAYFSGATTDATLTRYEWTGTADASTSILQTREALSPVPVWNPSDTRTFDLAITSREVSHDGREITVEAATDESILQNYAQTTQDIGAFAHQSSLRAVCNFVLNKVISGAALQPGTLDANVTTYTDATNLFKDPRFTRTPGGGYSQERIQTMVDNDFPNPVDGVEHYGVHLHTPTSADSFIGLNGATGTMAEGLQAGKTYTVSAEGSVRMAITGEAPAEPDAVKPGLHGRARAIVIHARVGTGAYQVWHSAQVPNVVQSGPNNGTQGTRVSVTFTVPVGATEAFIRFYHGGTGGTITWGKFQLVEHDPRPGVDNTAYFWGSKPDTSEYLYEWTGTADVSTSRRVALIDRAPELLTWDPAETAWDFLVPIVGSAGFRLFCDEQRRWWLIDPAEFALPGRFVAQPSNTINGTDTIATNSGLYATGVIVRYTWRDFNGDEQTKDDTAGTGPYVDLLELKRPYPGPGLAAARLRTLQTRGRTQAVTTGMDYTITPGQEVAINLPGTYAQIGQLSSVRWQLTDGIQQIESANLQETPPGAIDLLSGTIDALPGTIDSLT
ncbi:hypothetical protein [Microbacterium invictum]|uniref:Minor tail protein n=1 Tax=Microbacterium invictum TaxID=515415 RepID=A0ABZ0VFR1_9MICO|nr:hypothetical protein [Microbacterium invictum]WQB71959.1 hypothetical protein T9R20_08450 [Microbacterium invictum]